MTDDPLTWPDERFMTRHEASAYARALGLRMAVATLAKAAWRGDGPPMHRMGKRPYYRVGEFRAWLRDRLSP